VNSEPVFQRTMRACWMVLDRGRLFGIYCLNNIGKVAALRCLRQVGLSLCNAHVFNS
jgi:hypothetical protein